MNNNDNEKDLPQVSIPAVRTRQEIRKQIAEALAGIGATDEFLEQPMLVELPFGEGEIIKNYKEMCSLLEEKIRDGNAKKSQLNRWKKYFSWEKKGHKFIITKILNRSYPARDDNSFGFSCIAVEERGYCNMFDKHKVDITFSKLFDKTHNFYFPEESKSLGTQRFVYLALGYYAPFSKMLFENMRADLAKNNLLHRVDIQEIITYWEDFLDNILQDLPTRFKKFAKRRRGKKIGSIPTRKKRHVYRFKNKLNEVIYVGKTSTSLHQRMYQHFYNGHLNKEAYQEVDAIEYLTFSTRLLMDQAELYFIVKYQPTYNTMQKHDEFIKLDLYESIKWLPIGKEVVTDLKKLLA